METCDLRFYSVEKVEAEAERRRLEGDAGEPGQEDIGKLEDGDEEPANDDEASKDEDEEKEDKKTPEVTASPTGPSSLYKKKEFSDVAFFRLGYFDYLKLNTQNMLQ